ncbi:MAG: hypothetical protein RIA69_11780 [Cyclobacteriaceae bacterium]
MEQLTINKTISKRLKGKIDFIKQFKFNGFPMNLFFKHGNGIETLKFETGHLQDFKGLFVIYSYRNNPVIVGSSSKVLQEIQNLIRGKRKTDRDQLKNVANHFGYRTWLAGQSYVKEMKVCWVEVTRDIDLKALKSIFNDRKIALIDS